MRVPRCRTEDFFGPSVQAYREFIRRERTLILYNGSELVVIADTGGIGMIITPDDFVLSCECGREHKVSIKRIVIEKNCLPALPAHMAELGISGKICGVYDSNTYAAAGKLRPQTDYDVVLPSINLHADERAVKQLTDSMPPDVKVLVAVGGGTIHDITRYSAAQKGICFVSAPTAASVDGFASSVAAMTWKGFKVTMPAAAPVLILADISIISQAPAYLSVSGVGDILGKYICLADWKIAGILTGEYYCDGIARLMEKAVNEVRDCCAGLKRGDSEAFVKLTYGLILSGIAMQLSGNSRPASGAEHHISHFIEMGVVGSSDALHGEKVGVGTLICAKRYHELGAKQAVKAKRPSHFPLTGEYLQPVYGSMTEGVLDENRHDVLEDVDPAVLEEKWPEIAGIISGIPAYEQLLEILQSISARTTLADIGISETKYETILEYSPYMRSRLTLLRASKMLQ